MAKATARGRPVPEATAKANDEVVVFEYIKSAYFRVIHADGAIGAVTPEGNIHFSLFSNRPAIPRLEVYAKNADGTLGDLVPEHTVVRAGIIREMDVDVIINPATAQALVNWLNANLAIIADRESKIGAKASVRKNKRSN
ncbi:hypothetical protein NKI88_03185 [Mesorhizobium sp. M0317]|uniref:hypothetical protein n=1 Tax=Mesorhizobium sp. M0317 TaxID=2956935 RepID=UPI0033389500